MKKKQNRLIHQKYQWFRLCGTGLAWEWRHKERMITSRERRKEARHKIWMNVAVVTSDAMSFEAVVTTISPSGLHLRIAKAILPGTEMTIFMQLEEEITFRGTSVWILDAVDDGKMIYEVGIKNSFIALPGVTAYEQTEKAKILQEILKQIKAR